MRSHWCRLPLSSVFFSLWFCLDSNHLSATGGSVLSRFSSLRLRRRLSPTHWPPSFSPAFSVPLASPPSASAGRVFVSKKPNSPTSVADSVAAALCCTSASPSQTSATDSYLNQAFSFPSHDSKGALPGGHSVASTSHQQQQHHSSAAASTNLPWLRPSRSALKANVSPHHHPSAYFSPPAAAGAFAGGNYFASSSGASESGGVVEHSGNYANRAASAGEVLLSSSGATVDHFSRSSKSSSAMHAIPHLSSSSGHGHHHHHQSSSSSSSQSKPVKVKRTRQRVDAGEPRNSYASIANFSSRGGYHGYHPSHKFGSSHSSSSNSSSSHHSTVAGSAATNGVAGSLHQHQHQHQQHQHQHLHQHQQHHQQHSLAMASQANTANVAPPHPSNQAEQVFASKQMREASAFNAAAMAAAAAAASSRPDMILDPALMQMYQNQMAALMNAGTYSQPQQQQQQSKATPPGPSAMPADQLALNNVLCNANAFFNQLQADASIASLMNNFNMESAAAAALLNPTSMQAQMLRELLESGSRELEKSSNGNTSQQQQQAVVGEVTARKNSLSPKSKSRSSSKLFADLELESDPMDFADPFAQLKGDSEMDRYSLATPGEDGAHDEEKSGDEERQHSGGGGGSLVEENHQQKQKQQQQQLQRNHQQSSSQPQQQQQQQQQESDSRVKAKEGKVGYMDGDGEQERVEEDVKGDEAKETIRPSGSDCGSGKEATEMASEEVAKTAAARDGNSAKEEQRGRGRPSPALSQRRAKSPTAYSTLASGSTSSADGGTSLGDETSSSASFTAKIAKSADQQPATTSASATTQLAHSDNSHYDSLSNTALLPTTDFTSADDQVDDEDRLATASVSAAAETASFARSTSPTAHSKGVRVEDIFSNMLLMTNSNGVSTGATTPSSPTNHVLSPPKSYDGESDSSLAKPSHQAQGVNGCKKRKLYQPQQSSKLQNGSLDTEDDDMDEEEVITPKVELGVEAELDEGFDANMEIDRRRHVSPAQADLPKEMEQATPPTMPTRHHSTRSEHLPTKRARLSDFEREYKLPHNLQSQLYGMQAKIALQQLYAQQQQVQSQRVLSSSNGSSQNYARTSPVNIAHGAADCDNLVDERDRAPTSRSGTASQFAEMDSLIESLKGQIISDIGRIIDGAFRKFFEDSARPEFQSHSRESRGNELLAQMLDSKYPRSQSVRSAPAKAISLNNGAKNLGRDGSPFALPSEASTAPKTFGYPPTSLPGGLYGKQPFYSSQNVAAAYSNSVNSNGLLLNGLREGAPLNNNNNTNNNNNINNNGLGSNGNNNSNSPYGRDNASPVLPEQSEALSLVVAPKKRRNKVTDSRLTPRPGNRLGRDDDRSSVSPPMSSMPFNASALGGVASLAGLQHVDFFDTGATPFPFADQSRLSSLFANGIEEADLKPNMPNGVSGVPSASNPVANAVVQAAAAHHLQLLAASRASPDSLNGYPASLLTSFGRGSVTGSENGGDGSETNDTQSIYDPSMPMISFSQSSNLRLAPSLPSSSAHYLPFAPSVPSAPSSLSPNTDHSQIDYCSLTSLHTSTLSPMHLRKAKLMFFYVRYPSSSTLKTFFPDIKFNKNNTAQLVKWFSNFR